MAHKSKCLCVKLTSYLTGDLMSLSSWFRCVDKIESIYQGMTLEDEKIQVLMRLPSEMVNLETCHTMQRCDMSEFLGICEKIITGSQKHKNATVQENDYTDSMNEALNKRKHLRRGLKDTWKMWDRCIEVYTVTFFLWFFSVWGSVSRGITRSNLLVIPD